MDAKVKAASAARGVKRMALGFMLAAAGTLAISSWAQVPGGPGGPGGHGGHGPRGVDGFGGPGLFIGPAEHTGPRIDRMLDGLNATDAQRAQIKKIALVASADLKAQHDAARGEHEQGLALFTAPVVDARAVEALRQKRVAQHDQSSKRVTQALLDISAVLTPEQRVKLGERMTKRAERMKERQERRALHGAASGPTR